MTKLPLPVRSYPAVTAKSSSIEPSLTLILLYMICSISLTYYNAIAYAYTTSDAIVKNIDVSIKGTSKNWAKLSSGLPSHHEKVSPGAGFVWISQLCQSGRMAIFRGALKSIDTSVKSIGHHEE